MCIFVVLRNTHKKVMDKLKAGEKIGVAKIRTPIINNVAFCFKGGQQVLCRDRNGTLNHYCGTHSTGGVINQWLLDDQVVPVGTFIVKKLHAI